MASVDSESVFHLYIDIKSSQILSGINPDHRHQLEILALEISNKRQIGLLNNFSNHFATRHDLNNEKRIAKNYF